MSFKEGKFSFYNIIVLENLPLFIIFQIQYYKELQMMYCSTQLGVFTLYLVAGLIWYGQVEQ